MTEEGKGERRWPRKMSRLEGGAWALECQWKARWRSHSWAIKSWARGKENGGQSTGRGYLWNVRVGIASEMATPLLGRGEKNCPKRANGCPVPRRSRGGAGGYSGQ